MVGFRNLVGTGIAPVSKKTAVKTRPALIRVQKLQRQSKWALLATYLPTYVQEHNELHFVM